MIGTVIGTLIVMVIRAAMVYLEVDATHQRMIFGIVLIAAIAPGPKKKADTIDVAL